MDAHAPDRAALLQQLIEQSTIAHAPAAGIPAVAYRRIRPEGHSSWVAVIGSGISLLVTLPFVSPQVGAIGSTFSTLFAGLWGGN